ncbi:glycosyltransferase family 4 protein [Alteromonas hispanica]|uniref:Glycosyltransferase n=1 Tax=Alteromonas hispanica TaxID=315421 RepID=A0A6L9MTW9_9ALTE|nr:glycosyltransferase family 1 protein [Alteromonas hispanica]NDW21606.1 glycosyltransferase [Alteromonas hispanica]
MKIGIYCESVKVSNKTGISRYVIGLVEALLKEKSDNIFYLYYQSDSVFSKPLPWLYSHPQVIHRPIFSPSDLASNRPRIWWDYLLPFHIWKDKISVFHGPNHFLPKTKVPTVLTIHDLAYFYMNVHGPGLDRILRHWTTTSMQRATKVITVSNSTKNDCIRENCPSEKISTIYQGFEGNRLAKLSEPDLQKPYILFLGTLQPRKNIDFLINAFSNCAQKIPHQLIIAGAPGPSSRAVLKAIEHHNLEERIKVTGFISDTERQELYLGASCFVYPSKYEGFGLVVLEAMSYGVPVITTNNSSLPEAVGSAGVTVNENSTEELSGAILKIVTCEETRLELRRKGLAHVKSFSWDRCSKNTLKVYEEATKIKGIKQ